LIELDHIAEIELEHLTVPNHLLLTTSGFLGYNRWEKDRAAYKEALIRYPQMLLDVLERSWFQRMWTIQEVALASKCTILCGSKSVSWEKFSTALERLESFPIFQGISLYVASHSIPRKYFQTGRRIFKREDSQKLCVSKILTYTRGKNATDLRDKVYALYGMLERLGVNPPEPDYSKPAADIYRDITIAAIVHDSSLEVLKQVEGHKSISDLPSWVPDWSNTNIRRFPSNIFYEVPWKIPMRFSLKAGCRIICLFGREAGSAVDVKTGLGIQHDMPMTFDLDFPTRFDLKSLEALGQQYINTIKVLRAWLRHIRDWHMLTSTYKYNMDDALGMMLRQGVPLGDLEVPYRKWVALITTRGVLGACNSLESIYDVRNHHNNEFPGLEPFYRVAALRYWTELPEWQVFLAIKSCRDARKFHRVACQALNGRKIVSFHSYSEKKLPVVMTGLVPNSCKAGDLLALFAGADYPMVVRPVKRKLPVSPLETKNQVATADPEEKYYSLVGPAYVLEMMSVPERVLKLMCGPSVFEINNGRTFCLI
jgi:hypothetical protein